MKKFFVHLKTVVTHRHEVCKLCFKAGLYWQGLTHDLSKFSPTEFINGVKFATGKKSPQTYERKRYGYSKAWLHHKGRNKHHSDYWVDIRPNGKSEPVNMPFKYIVEMLCDRVAASMIYLGDKFTAAAPLEYYETHKNENEFHEQTRYSLEQWLKHIALTGVDETFKILKERLKRR